MNDADKALALKLRRMREAYEAERDALLDAHMADNYADRLPFWRAATRASIEVASWPKWKRQRCYAQPGEKDIEEI